ncbi:MAG: tetratricopeptide repeat protein [Ktedonobacteraceae bacterium]
MEQHDQDQVFAPTIDQLVRLQSLLEHVSEPGKEDEWESAFQLLYAYMQENPYHGDLWHELGEHYERRQQYDLARAAYHKALEYGNCRSGITEYQLARTLVRQDKIDEVSGWLEQSFRHSLRALKELDSDAIWEPLRSDPRFAHFFSPRVAEDIDRNEGWRGDLTYLKARMEQTHHELFGRETPLTQDVLASRSFPTKLS